VVVQQITGSVAFFKTMAPILIANILTVTFVYCFVRISQNRTQARGRGYPHIPLADRRRLPIHVVRAVCLGRASVQNRTPITIISRARSLA
jgi:hypothetical protein